VSDYYICMCCDVHEKKKRRKRKLELKVHFLSHPIHTTRISPHTLRASDSFFVTVFVSFIVG